MRRLRVPIAAVMLSILLIAVGLAALRDPSELWASALFTATILALLVSILGTVARRGAARMAFLGFALFGTSYLVLAFGPWPWTNPDGLRPPPLVTRVLLDQLRESEVGPASDWKDIRFEAQWYGTFQHLATCPADLTFVPPPAGSVQTPSLSLLFDISPYKQIAHSVMALVAGVLGAIAGRIITPRQTGSLS
jgi:hypothetical protein